MAVSSSKCNGVDDGRPIRLEVERALGQEQLGRRLPAQGLARFGVVVKGDGIELLLGVDAQVRALGQDAAQQAVGVLIDAPLPRTVGMGKEHLDAGALAQRLVIRRTLLADGPTAEERP